MSLRLSVLASVLVLSLSRVSAAQSAPPLPPPAPSSAPATPPSEAPSEAPSSASASVELRILGPRDTAQPAPRDAGAHAPARAPAAGGSSSVDDDRFLHGFRIGASYTFKYDEPVEGLGGKSLREQASMRSPAHFLLGYEVVYRVVSQSWLNVILLGNAMVAGLEQSKFYPSANGLLGFELKNAFQIGVGANLSPLKGSEAHAMIAAGWTPRVGKLYVPVHAFFIPDVDGVHRTGMTTGVTF